MSKTKSFGAKPRISKVAVERAFLDWLLGASLRDLPKKYGFHHNTFWYQFRKIYGVNYSSLPRAKGVVTIIKEYLNNKKLSVAHRKEINEFLEANKEILIQTDLSNTDKVLYTERQMRNLTWAECSHTENDYKKVFEVCLLDDSVEDMYDLIDDYDYSQEEEYSYS